VGGVLANRPARRARLHRAGVARVAVAPHRAVGVDVARDAVRERRVAHHPHRGALPIGRAGRRTGDALAGLALLCRGTVPVGVAVHAEPQAGRTHLPGAHDRRRAARDLAAGVAKAHARTRAVRLGVTAHAATLVEVADHPECRAVAVRRASRDSTIHRRVEGRGRDIGAGVRRSQVVRRERSGAR
jgi:hypothetical protein